MHIRREINHLVLRQQRIALAFSITCYNKHHAGVMVAASSFTGDFGGELLATLAVRLLKLCGYSGFRPFY